MPIFKSSSDFGRGSSVDKSRKIKCTENVSKLIKLLDDSDVLDPEAWIKAFNTPVDFYCFYATKLQTIVHEMNKAERFLQECKTVMDKGENLKEEIVERDAQLFDLQNDVTDLKCTLLQERTNYQSLLREHELVKLEKEDYYRKFNAALLLGGVTERDVGFLMQNNPKSSALLNKIGEVKDEIAYHKSSIHEQDNPLVLRKKIEILESQVRSLEKSRQGDCDAFQKTLGFSKEELRVAQKRSIIEAQKAADEIRDVKALYYCLMKSKMDLLRKVISLEEEHLETKVELSELKEVCDLELFERGTYSKPVMEKVAAEKRPDFLKVDLERTKNLLTEKETIIKEYELKFCCMEKEYRRFKEVQSVAQQQYEVNRNKLFERIKVLEQRCEKDDQRRKLENSGFHQDIRSLKQFLTTLEKRVNSTIIKQNVENMHGKQDVAVCARKTCNYKKAGNANLKFEKHFSNPETKHLNHESLKQIFRLASARLAEIENKVKGT